MEELLFHCEVFFSTIIKYLNFVISSAMKFSKLNFEKFEEKEKRTSSIKLVVRILIFLLPYCKVNWT